MVTWVLICLVLWFLGNMVVQNIVVKLWLRPRRLEKQFSKQGIRGPPYRFGLGNTKEMVALMLKASSQPMSLSHNVVPRVLSFYSHWKKLYGSPFLMWFGPTARLVVSDPDLIREIFTTKAVMYEKPLPLIRDLEGDGLLNLKGHKWAHHRKIISPAFYTASLGLLLPEMGKSVSQMLETWTKMSDSAGKMEIEISECFQTLTEEVVTRAVFGSSYEDGKAIFQLQAKQMVFAVEAFQKIFIPGYRYLPTKRNRISWKLDREIRKSLVKLIHARRVNLRDEEEEVEDRCPRDLLELMIRAGMREEQTMSAPDSGSVSSSPPPMFAVNDILEECKGFFFAGKHTTSNLLTWTTILLAMHPEWQKKAREEVLRVCGSRDVPTKDDVSQLKTVGMIVNESLRLYPPAVAVIRRAAADVVLGGSTIIPGGMELLIPIIAVHHDPKLWGPDATDFNPTRFARGGASAANHPTAFIPFGLGSRRCIGQSLATLQTKLVVAMIIRRFSIDLSPSYKHAPTVLMLLHPQYGAPLIFRTLAEDPPMQSLKFW